MALDVKEEQYCILLSKYRVYQGLALYYSLKKTMTKFKLYILCVDKEAFEFIKTMIEEDATAISLESLEDDYLYSLKQNRLLEEYCWTLKPVFIEYLLNSFSDIKRITYLDADLFFYSEPNKIFEDTNEYSVLLSSHDFSRQYKSLERYCGVYNSGLISFGNNAEGRACINWWKNRCYDLCSKQFSNNQFGDQKYLEHMPIEFENVMFIKAHGVNIAPWNHSKYVFSNKEDLVLVNNEKLICYHFSGFKLMNDLEFTLNFGNEKKPNSVLYKPYIQMINKALIDYKKIKPNNEDYFTKVNSKKSVYSYKISMFNKTK